MTATSHVEPVQPQGLSGGALWAGMIGAPVIWSLDLILRYVLVPLAAARQDDQTPMNVCSAIFFLSTLACAFICWRDWRLNGSHDPGGHEPGPTARRQFVASVGLLTSLLFAFIIVAEAMPSFFIDSRVD
jgi:hypothetical protein